MGTSLTLRTWFYFWPSRPGLVIAMIAQWGHTMVSGPRPINTVGFWRDESGDEQWTVCNPSGAITSQYAMDKIPGGEVGPGPDIITPIGQIDEGKRKKKEKKGSK